MNDIILLKQGEMILKGANRRSFEQRLESSVKKRAEPFGKFKIYSVQSVIYVEPASDTCDTASAFKALRDVFGIVSLSLCRSCEKSADAILETAKTYLREELSNARSFKVETKRADKTFPMTSVQLSQYIGGELSELFPNAAPDMHSPELSVRIEIRESAAYVQCGAVRGAGGLPHGSSGKAVALLSGGIDSPVAVYLAAKRGLKVFPIHFHSYPYTSENAKQKVLDLARVLTRYTGSLGIEIVPFTRIQEEIAKNCPDEYGTIITRRFMTEIADKIAYKKNAKAIITGENLGQVASQTTDALRCTEAVSGIPVLRPLICYDKYEITNIAERIGTFRTSILPYEDCCTVFTPKHPVTKPKLDKVIDAESGLDRAALIADAIERTERIVIPADYSVYG